MSCGSLSSISNICTNSTTPDVNNVSSTLHFSAGHLPGIASRALSVEHFNHLLLYHKCHAYVLSFPASQGHPVHWIALGPVLAIILVSSILLVLIAILLGALYKRRKTRCSGKQHTMLQIMTAFVDAILLHHFDNCDFTTSSLTSLLRYTHTQLPWFSAQNSR